MIPIRDTAPCNSRPYVTWTLMAICIVIFIAMKLMPFEQSNRLLFLYGMVPLRYGNPEWAVHFGLPNDYHFSFISNLFLHGGWSHLIINMWFMWIFGDNVEDRMGKFNYLCFYLLCGLLATAMQWYFDPMLAIPVVGASGAIAGVLAAYFFLYPMERVILWVPIFFLPIIIHVPAIGFLGLWVIIQLYKGSTSVIFEGGAADVAWWAHLGGFIAGGFLYRFFLKKEPPQ
ncbi:rhomboid family intramembrane serine protease [Methylicorpusculum oleiharenae]|uniref:rhomboid family intramembrane serine protease n=1 Tax=Methylicorpusculum oleiharenae TaxID=1338687 RepID=UPI0013576C9E|nr:rhomboid family intramembrane serine protease [Methylicorpusculum oleiharenae]MCD2452760.1 rhomboid family intramembrane serine protease [Methylicorpusculum oleiharenae]